MIRCAIRAWVAMSVLSAAVAAAEPPSSLRGAFSWTATTAEGEPRPPRQGRFAVQAPASYDIVVRDGDGGAVDRWCSDGVSRWEVSRLGPDEPADVRGPLPAGDGDEGARLVLACLRLDLAVLSARYQVAEPSPAEVELRPLADAPAGAARGIRIRRGPGGEPERVDIDLSDGSRWAIGITAREHGPVLDPAAFRPGR